MSRNFPNWLEAFCDYTSFCEAPRDIYFWVGVSTIAGALRRKVWIDQYFFHWYPNCYIVLVAPPEVAAKSTSVGIGMRLLRRVPGVAFGPNVVTWQAIIKEFTANVDTFEIDGKVYNTSSLTISSSELGNLLNPNDKQLIDMLISLWDGAPINKKAIITGSMVVDNPLLNINACTTPAWISDNMSTYMLGGGFLSRCIFVSANAKQKIVAYPKLALPPDIYEKEDKLVEDLCEISILCGEYSLTRDATEWGKKWYTNLFSGNSVDRMQRHQTHAHKLAMIISASKRNDLTITKNDLEEAVEWTEKIRPMISTVMANVGKSTDGIQAEKLIEYIRSRKRVKYEDALKQVYHYYPRVADQQSIVFGAVKAGYIKMVTEGAQVFLTAADKEN